MVEQVQNMLKDMSKIVIEVDLPGGGDIDVAYAFDIAGHKQNCHLCGDSHRSTIGAGTVVLKVIIPELLENEEQWPESYLQVCPRCTTNNTEMFKMLRLVEMYHHEDGQLLTTDNDRYARLFNSINFTCQQTKVREIQDHIKRGMGDMPLLDSPGLGVVEHLLKNLSTPSKIFLGIEDDEPTGNMALMEGDASSRGRGSQRNGDGRRNSGGGGGRDRSRSTSDEDKTQGQGGQGRSSAKKRKR